MYIVYLDQYHLEDPLFLQALGRALAKIGRSAPPMVFVHGAGEQAERRLEGEGFEVRRRGRTLDVSSTTEQIIVVQAARELNRLIVGILTDHVVHAVGIQGADRGLVRVREDGGLVIGKKEWLEELARKGAVPVISAVAETHAGVAEIDPALLTATLGRAIGASIIFLAKDGQPSAEPREMALNELGLSLFEETEAVNLVLKRGMAAELRRLPDLGREGIRLR